MAVLSWSSGVTVLNSIASYFFMYSLSEIWGYVPSTHHTFLNAYFSSLSTQIPFKVLALPGIVASQ